METKRLTQFQVVAKTGNLREAAGLLGISHAGLSKSLRVLEAELGCELLSRDGRNIKITPAGRRLIREMGFCLEAEERLLGAARGIDRQHRSRLRVGTFEVFSTYLSPELALAAPKATELVFEELIPGALEEALVNEEIDMGISYIAVPTAGLDHFEVARVKMGVYTGRALARDKKFAELPFVIPVSRVEGAPSKVRGLDGWPDDRIPLAVRYRVALMETAIALARQGLAAAYLPQFVAERHNRVARPECALTELASPLRGGAGQPVYAIKRKSDSEGPAFKALCRVLRTLR